MPRVARMPRAARGAGSAATTPPIESPAKSPIKSPIKSPVKIPLNDDAQERGQRMNSRKALHDAQIKQIKAAATPRKTAAAAGAARLQDSPSANAVSVTPRSSALDGDDAPTIAGTSVTPMKRVPILANFEEWMKMATDNKINATNSWNFALIDYFHDMSLLREGDGVNFQKASCTLDGCVKIYTNRVDSVATETGKLLSGLADSNSSSNKHANGQGAHDDDSDQEELDQDGNSTAKKKSTSNKHARSSEATLAPSFGALQLKKFELEFAVDPLFKKASADFDQGGAKGLLLNHLMIDSQGRIVFDSSDDAADMVTLGKQRNAGADHDDGLDSDGTPEPDGPARKGLDSMPNANAAPNASLDDKTDADADAIDLTCLRRKFLPLLSQLDDLDVCPSLKHFDLGDALGSLDIPFLKAPDYSKASDQSGIFIDDDDDEAANFDHQDQDLGTFEMGDDDDQVAFGEGGEAWARHATAGFDAHAHDDNNADEPDAPEYDDDEKDQGGDYVVSMADKMHQDMLGFFDHALLKNWTSAQHWRIRKIQDATAKAPSETRRRKDKEPFEIDFAAPLPPALADMVYTQASTKSAICLPRKDWKSKSRNLVPDDKHFSSKSLLSLFLKPKARLTRRRSPAARLTVDHQAAAAADPVEMDQAFWAARQHHDDDDHSGRHPEGDYDANFFHDDGLPFPAAGADDDDDNDAEFADACQDLPPHDGQAAAGAAFPFASTTVANASTTSGTAFGSSLVTQTRRLRPDYVQYARKAKKVDVRRLKQEIWKGMAFAVHAAPSTSPDASPAPTPSHPDKTLKFTHLIDSLQAVYPKPIMDDISTSYCFISLLHLANEKGLVIEHTPDLTELHITKDWTAHVIDTDD